MSLAAFAGLALLHLMAAISPGPSFVVSVRTAAAEGFRAAAGLAVGFGLGAAIWASLALSGLALLLELAPSFFAAVRIVGAAILIVIAIGIWRKAGQPVESPAQRLPRSWPAAVGLGLATQLGNPKVVIFFGAVFAGLVPPGTSFGILAVLVAVIFLNETMWYLVVARLFSLDRPRHTYAQAKRWVDRCFAGIIVAFGIGIAST